MKTNITKILKWYLLLSQQITVQAKIAIVLQQRCHCIGSLYCSGTTALKLSLGWHVIKTGQFKSVNSKNCPALSLLVGSDDCHNVGQPCRNRSYFEYIFFVTFSHFYPFSGTRHFVTSQTCKLLKRKSCLAHAKFVNIITIITLQPMINCLICHSFESLWSLLVFIAELQLYTRHLKICNPK